MSMTSSTRPELFVAGSPHEIGFQHGRAMATEIRQFLGDGLAAINRLRERPLSAMAVSRFVAESARWIERDVPDIAEQIAGIAAGADIPYEQAMLLQLRRELIRHPEEPGDCTSVAYSDGSGFRIAQNVDLAGNVSGLSLVLHMASADSSRPRICMLTFAGLCGYLGVNSHGLAVGINMITSDGWRAGVSPYLLVAHILGCSSVAEAIDELTRIHRASSRYLALADSRGAIGVEMTVDSLRILDNIPRGQVRSWKWCGREANAGRLFTSNFGPDPSRGPLLAHTNHFLHPDFQREETKSGKPLACSHARLQRIAMLAGRGADAEEMLRDHDGLPDSICVHSEGDERSLDTVAGVVMIPERRELRIAFGHPCESDFRSYFAD